MALLSSRQFDGNTYTFYLNASYSFFDDILDGMGDYDGGTSEPDYTDYPDYTDDNEEPEDEPDVPDEPTEYKIPIGSKTWYQLEVYHLSEELYNYCKAQYLKDFNILSNFGVTPPNFTYSNISGGIGIIGGISRFTPEKVPDPDNKEPEMPSMQDLLKLLQ